MKLKSFLRRNAIVGVVYGGLSFWAHPSLQGAAAEALPLRDRLQDEHAMGMDFWFYNDFAEARAEAERSGKPLFVTFRCVPCKDCKAFDAEVAKNSEVIRRLATLEFVPVRLVEMKGVNLSQSVVLA